ncbi:amino acid ABC transporter permease [Terrarubrum flagellatum]|uniref:amino acid ABC transporter permease n=1 Tax=Terrirubrum flagellatum TaxID=2895980 RepID=UPI0031456EC8
MSSQAALPTVDITTRDHLRRLRQIRFGSAWQVTLTLAFVVVALWIGWRILDWALVKATWVASDRAGCAAGGACWAFVLARMDQFMFGFYPAGERWRPATALLLPLVLFLIASIRPFPRQQAFVGLALLTSPMISLALLAGWAPGMTAVGSDKWGGLSLTWMIASTSFVASLPIAVLLALGRRSEMPVISGLCTMFIELWRGLPLVAILFLAVILLPLALPPGVTVGRFEMATTALTVYTAAYLAEVVRGGLQAIPIGQIRAARAIGFGYWRTQRYILLPQALGKVLPGVINTAIALVKDTSYVMVVGLFDFINIVTAALSDPKWLGSPIEGYAFVALIYWIVCFCLSRWGQKIERNTAGARGLERAG